jgi:hypothetical protein
MLCYEGRLPEYLASRARALIEKGVPLTAQPLSHKEGGE